MFKTHRAQWVLCLGKTCLLPNFKIASIISGLILLCTNYLTHPSGNTKLLFVSSNWLNVCPQTSVLQVCCIHNIKYGRLWNYSQQLNMKPCRIIFGATQVRPGKGQNENLEFYKLAPVQIPKHEQILPRALEYSEEFPVSMNCPKKEY